MDLSTEGLVEPGLETLTYNRYLKVSALTGLQSPLSVPEQHDETLFIIIHQVYELWFKQILHEMDAAVDALEQDELMRFVRAITRVIKIQEILTKQIDILETMTPDEFNLFRERLNPASGFQSFQFRAVEFRLGAKHREYLRFFATEPEAQRELLKILSEPSVYDHFVQHLSRNGYAIPDELLRRDYSQEYVPSDALRNVMLQVYRNPRDHYDVYLALEALIDLDEKVLLWRYRHVAMVERMIGWRRGTGGSSGAKYLSSTLQKRFFPEIWDVRNYLGQAIS